MSSKSSWGLRRDRSHTRPPPPPPPLMVFGEAPLGRRPPAAGREGGEGTRQGSAHHRPPARSGNMAPHRRTAQAPAVSPRTAPRGHPCACALRGEAGRPSLRMRAPHCAAAAALDSSCGGAVGPAPLLRPGAPRPAPGGCARSCLLRSAGRCRAAGSASRLGLGALARAPLGRPAPLPSPPGQRIQLRTRKFTTSRACSWGLLQPAEPKDRAPHPCTGDRLPLSPGAPLRSAVLPRASLLVLGSTDNLLASLLPLSFHFYLVRGDMRYSSHVTSLPSSAWGVMVMKEASGLIFPT